jgi:hypothetical protein
MTRIQRGLLSLLPLVIAGACSANGGSDPKYSSGVDGDLGLGNLTNAQQTTICTSQAAYLQAHIDTTTLTRFWCAFTPAVFGAADDASCEAAMDTTVNTSTCSGTVSEYEDCVNSLASVELNIGTDWACGTRAQYSSSPTVGISACSALGPTCTAVTGAPSQAVH